MIRIARKQFAALVIAAVISACLALALPAAPPARHSLQSTHRNFSDAPRKSAEQKNPYESQPAAVLAGAKLFRRYCTECHGTEARGIGSAPSLRSSRVRNARPGELFWFLRNGNIRAGMPSWSGLPDQRRWQLVSYLKSLH